LKRLVVNADDFGFAHDVNAGIIASHTEGILTATTLMANGSAFADGVRLAQENPELDVGVHLVLVGGNSLLTGLPLPSSVNELLHAMMRRRIRPYDELKPQIERIVAAGIRPKHLDTHKHTHLMPPVLSAVARLSEEYGIRWVRRPFDFPLSGGGSAPWSVRLLSRCMNGLRMQFHRALSNRGCLVTDYFAGFQMTGRFRTAELVALIRSLPEGITEFMCHPGRCTDELRAMRTRLKESREQEMKALVAPDVRQALVESGVELVRYRDLKF
jgi:chitin disaccharide deacetylase